jgi:DNA polymerase I-like protein with 3'-5' exonuclease and polymerase domains
VLLNFDLAGAEFVVVAYLCRDENMLDIVQRKKSPHVVTANRMFGVPEELILEEEKINGKISDPEVIAANRRTLGLSHPALPRTMSIRQGAKRNVHSGNYKIGPREFAIHNEIEEREAKTQINLYRRAYPKLPLWWNDTDNTIRKTRVLTNCFGRKCYFMGQIGEDTFKQAYAFVPQSTVADDCTQAMVKTFEDPRPYMQAPLLAQVHDSLLYDYAPTNFLDMAAFAIQVGRDYMRPVLSYHGADFQLDTDLKVGFDWAHMLEIKLTDDVDALATKLSEAPDLLRAEYNSKKAA